MPHPARRFLLLLGATLFAAGCATTNETDAHEIKGRSFLFERNRLEKHLESRRQLLAALQQKIDDLDRKSMSQITRLRQLASALAKARAEQQQTNITLEQLDAQIVMQRSRAESTLNAIERVQAEIARVQAESKRVDVAATNRLEQYLRTLQSDAQRLKAENDSIEASIRRIEGLFEDQRLRDRLY